MSHVNQWDYEVLRRTLYGEARNQDLDEMIAVAWVVKNRADALPIRWWGRTIAEVCLKPLQFSCWNSTDVNRQKLILVTEDDAAFRQCSAAALQVLDGLVPDPTGEATHYFTINKPSWAKTWPPPWAERMTLTARIGAHSFHKE